MKSCGYGRIALLLLAGGATPSFGCSGARGALPLAAAPESRQDVTRTIEAVVAYAEARGWQVSVSHHRLGIVEASAPLEGHARERWSFYVDGRGLRISRSLETRGADGYWRREALAASDGRALAALHRTAILARLPQRLRLANR